MCLINFAYKSHPDYDLILAANRDEFFARPTKQADYWTDVPGLIAGKDLEQGGTWLGITQDGRFAALTNFREVREKQHERSRGELVLDFLNNNISSEEYLNKINEKRDEYLGFNLLCGSVDELYYYSNRQNGIERIEPGVHSVSNALLNTSWPKVERGKALVEETLKEDGNLVKRLLDGLTNDEKAEEQHLPQTGVGVELEKHLSPMFIKMEGYGTRCSTVITISKSRQVTFCERTYLPGHEGYEDRLFQFSVASKSGNENK
ncbi:NRDE family protein [Alkalihalobacillus sp. BA299]|uniref:NRDE family protein n=1 Tax=Alkalihalobacillus sp. BA299 TaxID=2815938 RepID=UPI001ADCDB00|nr:NRDE family protein [Alkalihalobacillus sp. BA299]